jgi:peptidoglycan/LPS O-acetylase OafA/YrhL
VNAPVPAESQAQAVAPPPGNPRFPLVDSMRGIAAVMIVILHVAGQVYSIQSTSSVWTYLMHFDLGVTIFFLISGFLLYRPFLAARFEGRPPIRVRDYARRRVLRIVPAYWVALTLLGLWPGLLGLWESGWPRYYLFGQVYSRSTDLAGLPVAWTLCIEASFYVLLPFLAAGLALLARGANPRQALYRELAALVAITAGSIVLQATIFAPHGSLPTSTLPPYMDWFAYGMMLAVLSVAWRQNLLPRVRTPTVLAGRSWLWWLAATVAFWVLCTQLALPRNPFQGLSTHAAVSEHTLQALIAALLLAPALFGDSRGGWPRRTLASRPLAWCGLVSYGVFLYHGPLIAKLRGAGAASWIPGSRLISLMVVTLAVSLALAAASYYLLERPILRLKDRRPKRQPQQAVPREGASSAHSASMIGAPAGPTD